MKVVYVLGKNGEHLAPTTRCGHVRCLLKEGKAKVVSTNPFTIQLLYEEKFCLEKGNSIHMSKKNRKNIVIAIAMVAVLALSGIAAYFTATDSATNTFTVGSVEVDQTEPTWDNLPDTDHDGIPDPAEDVVPNKEIDKDPMVKNTGINDAYVFTAVAVPKKVVKVAKVDGSAPAQGVGSLPAIDADAQMTQLFQLNATKNGTKTMTAEKVNASVIGKTSTGVVTRASNPEITAAMPTKSVFTTAQPALEESNANAWTGVDSWNDAWYLLDVNNTLADNDNATGASAIKSYLDDYNVYIFAYGSNSAMTELAADHETPKVFESITVANAINVNDLVGAGDEDRIDYDSKLEGTMPQILVKTFAIQKDNLKSNGDNPAPTVAPAEVWKVLNNQDGAYRALADELADLNAKNSAWQAPAVYDNVEPDATPAP